MKKIIFILLCAVYILVNSVSISFAQERDVKIAGGYRHIVVLNKYGRVHASGYNEQGQCDVYGWKDVVDICAGKYFTAALFEEGTVKTTDETIDTTEFTNIIKIDAGDNFIAALDGEGNVHIAGQLDSFDSSQWQGIIDIAAGDNHLVGLKEDGSCIGVGTGMERLNSINGIKNIYAGAGLTVFVNNEGKLDYIGIGTYEPSTDVNEGDMWKPGEWDGNNIKKIDIIRGSHGNGIVVALQNDNTIIFDGMSDDAWTITENITGVEDFAMTSSCEYLCMAVIDVDMSVKSYGFLDSDVRNATSWSDDIKKIKPSKEPLELEEKKNIAVGYHNVGLLLPSNKLKVFGKGTGAELENIESFMYLRNEDHYIYYDKGGKMHFNVTVENDSSADTRYTWNKPNDLSLWTGIEKVAVDRWDGENELITGLRWDGQIYSTNADDAITKKESDAVDIIGGNYFTAVLHSDKTVSTYEVLQKNDFSDVKNWTDIKNIYVAYRQLIGEKEDGSYVAVGGTPKNGETKETIVSDWRDIIGVAGGYGFTVGLTADGTCKVSANNDTKSQKAKADIETWSDVKEIYSAYSSVVGYKNDGTFEVFEFYERPEFVKLEDIYYKDNEYFYDKSLGNKVNIEYISQNETELYIVVYGENGDVRFEKKTLNPVEDLTEIEFVYEDAKECFTYIGKRKDDTLPLYIESEQTQGLISVNYMAENDIRMIASFYDEEGNMTDVRVKTANQSNEFKTIEFSSDSNWEYYKLLVWDGMTPVYNDEGTVK